jgi:hypothetical protein
MNIKSKVLLQMQNKIDLDEKPNRSTFIASKYQSEKNAKTMDNVANALEKIEEYSSNCADSIK